MTNRRLTKEAAPAERFGSALRSLAAAVSLAFWPDEP